MIDCGFYCGLKEEVMSESKIKRENKCKDFCYCDVGDVITGKQYKSHKHHKQHGNVMQGQLSLADMER